MAERLANIVFTIVFLVACGVFTYIAIGIEENSAFGTEQMSSRFFPLVLLGVMGVLGLINLIQYIRGNPEGPIDEKVDLSLDGLIRMVLIFFVTVGSYFVWERFGFLPMAFLMMLSLALILRVRSLWVYGGLLIYSVAVMYLFEAVLRIRL